jgi:hypothetical protein
VANHLPLALFYPTRPPLPLSSPPVCPALGRALPPGARARASGRRRRRRRPRPQQHPPPPTQPHPPTPAIPSTPCFFVFFFALLPKTLFARSTGRKPKPHREKGGASAHRHPTTERRATRRENGPAAAVSLSLSLTHTHTHTHARTENKTVSGDKQHNNPSPPTFTITRRHALFFPLSPPPSSAPPSACRSFFIAATRRRGAAVPAAGAPSSHATPSPLQGKHA